MTTLFLFELGKNHRKTMKAILKGLKYILQIFGSHSDHPKKKDSEMVIGAPTDVKHVAHIGNDGPSANTPSWMNEYNAATEVSSKKKGTSEKQPKKSRGKSSNGSGGSPFGSSEMVEKHNRRRSSNDSMESPSKDPPHHRKNRNSNLSAESPEQDTAKNNHQKHSRQKKSSKGSKTKGHNSLSADVAKHGSEIGPYRTL